jgi:hypothetical protein
MSSISDSVVNMPTQRAIDAEMCGDIYDETRETLDPNLVAQIEKFEADTAVDVHTLVLGDGSQYGISNNEDLQRFNEDLVDDCDFDQPDHMVVSISTSNPRTADTYVTDEASDVVSLSTLDAQNDTYLSSLADRESPYQRDIAGLLERVNPTSEAVPTTTEPQQPSEPLNIPFAKIGIGASAVVVAGAVGARIVQGVRVSKIFKQPIKDANNRKVSLEQEMSALELQLAIIPKEDAKPHREALQAGIEALVKLVNETDAAQAALRETRRKAMPRTHAFTEMIRRFENTIIDAHQAENAMSSARADLENDRARIQTLIEDSKAKMGSIKTRISQLREDNWKLGELGQAPSEFERKLGDIEWLRAQHYVDTPAELADALAAYVESTSTRIDDISCTYTQQRDILGGLNQKTDQLSHTNAQTLVIFQGLKRDYGQSNYHDLEQLPTQSTEALTGYKREVFNAHQTAGVKDVDVLEQYTRALSGAESHSQNISAIYYSVVQRRELLDEVAARISGDVADLKAKADETKTFTLDAGSDVEQSTHRLVDTLERDISELEQSLTQQQPDYLAAHNRYRATVELQRTTIERARAERDEMVKLRDQLDDAHKKLAKEHKAAEQYTNKLNVKASTKEDIRGLEVPDFDNTGRRQELRERLREYDDQTSAIGALVTKAKSDIRKAQQRNAMATGAGAGAIAHSPISFGGGGGGGHSGGDF